MAVNKKGGKSEMKRLITSLAVVCIISTLARTKAAFADLKDGLVAYYPFFGGNYSL
jgi:hypothetical protein